MKKSKRETRYTITLSNGEKITATGAMLNLMCRTLHQSARRESESGFKSYAKEQLRIGAEIYNFLKDKGYFR